MPRSSHEDIIIALAPLFENNHPSPEICDFFSKVMLSLILIERQEKGLTNASAMIEMRNLVSFWKL